MFQFPACPPVRLWIHLTVTASSTAGFPHSDINGSVPACGSPLLFAACHVLLRRMVPGHPPCALCSLIFSSLILRPIVFSPLPFGAVHPSGSIRNWPFLNLYSLCSCQGALSANPEDDTELSTRKLLTAFSVFERSLTFRFASLKL